MSKALSKGHCKTPVTSSFRIGSDTKGADSSKCGTGGNKCGCISFRWVFIGAGKFMLGYCTVVDFECDVARDVLIFEIDLAEL